MGNDIGDLLPELDIIEGLDRDVGLGFGRERFSDALGSDLDISVSPCADGKRLLRS
jgi:hypothetical protein